MSKQTTITITSYFLSLLTIGFAVIVWLPSVRGLTAYSLFPLLGLIAFGLMWSHYINDSLRRLYRLPKSVLRTHFRLTSPVVLACLLLHPFLFELQLYLDGLGLPPASMFEVYAAPIERAALFAGSVAFVSFLLFELHRLYATRPWWRYIGWLNIGAMALILWHGLVLGSELRSDWFQIVWWGYAVTFALSAAYNEYDKQRSPA